MKRLFSIVLLLTLATFTFGTGSALAVPIINPNGAGLIALQGVFDGITTSPGAIHAVNDQALVELFNSTASGGAVATFIIELAGFAGSNTFGIYSQHTLNKAEVFAGASGAGSQALVSFLANGNILVNNVLAGTGFGGAFGFYIDVSAGLDPGTFYSEDNLNPGGARHSLFYEGDNTTSITIPPFLGGPFIANEFIVAFEDLQISGGVIASDEDYTDLVVLVESITPIPEPSTLLLLGFGLVGIGIYGKRRRKS